MKNYPESHARLFEEEANRAFVLKAGLKGQFLVGYMITMHRIMLVEESKIKYDSRRKLDSSAKAAALLMEVLRGSDREKFVVVALDARNKVLGINVASVGTLTQAQVSPREIGKYVFLLNAAAMIIGHCHPSGDPNPSDEDKIITAKLKQCCELFEVRFVDHIICGLGSYFSFSEKGLISNLGPTLLKSEPETQG